MGDPLNENFASVSSFMEKSFVKTPGFARTSRFMVDFQPPDTFLNNTTTIFKGGKSFSNTFLDLKSNVISVELPSMGLSSNKAPYSHQITGRTEPGNISIKFWESNELHVKDFFNLWIESYMTPFEWGSYQVNKYFDDTVINIVVKHIHESGIYEDKADVFQKCWPTSVSNIGYNVKNENELAEINVTFQYLFHTISKVSNKDKANPNKDETIKRKEN